MKLRHVRHELHPARPGKHQIQEDEPGLLCPDQAEKVAVVARRGGGVTGGDERVSNAPERVRVVVDDQDAGGLASVPERSRAARGSPGSNSVVEYVRDRYREGEPRALAEPRTLRPDPPSVSLDEAFRDEEAKAGPVESKVLIPAGQGDFLLEEVRQSLRGNAASLVRNRDGDVGLIQDRAHVDGSGDRGVPGGIREEVGDDLNDAPGIDHHPREIWWQVDLHALNAPPAQKRPPRLVHEIRNVRRLGVHRERAGVDAPGVQQIADEPLHAVDLLVDDPEELPYLRRIEARRRPERRRRRTLDGDERGAKLVTHNLEELRALALELFERGQILNGGDYGDDRAVLGPDRGRVEEGGDVSSVRHGEHDLLGAYGLGISKLLGEEEFVKADLAPVGTPAGKDLEALPGRLPGLAEIPHDALRFAVYREQFAGRGIEDHNADGRGLDKGLEVGPRALLCTVGTGVRDGGRGLSGKEYEDLLVFDGERLPALLLGKVEIADMRAPVPHGRSLESARRQECMVVAERTDVGEDVGDTEWPRKVAEVPEEPRPVGPLREPPVLLVAEARSDEVLGSARGVDGRDGTVAGSCDCAGALDYLAKDGLEVETVAHAKDCAGQYGDALAERLDVVLSLA